MINNKKTVFLIWENPKSHQVILPLVKKFSKISQVYMVSQRNKKIDKLNEKDSDYKKYCKMNQVFYSHKIKYLNKFFLFYYYLLSLVLIIYLKPNYIYVINKYPLLVIFFIKKIFNCKIIYHNLDYEPNPKSFFHRFLSKVEKYSINYIDLLIFSHKKRGERFLKDKSVKKNLLVFFNSLPKQYFKKYLTKVKKNKIKKIIYFGSIGEGHGLKTIIKSFKYLDDCYKMYICGWVINENYLNSIKNIINNLKLNNQVFIKQDLKDYEWKSKMIESDLGVAIYENTSFSHQFMFTASQKINAFLAAGLPFIILKNKDFSKYNKEFKCCIEVKLKPKELSKAVKSLFKNKKKYRRIRKNSKNIFIKNFNFENQFEKIEKYLKL